MRKLLSFLLAICITLAAGSARANPTHEVRDLVSGQIRSCECKEAENHALQCDCIVVPTAQFPVWKTVTIGETSIAGYRAAFNRSDINVSDWAHYLLDRTYVYRQLVTVDLVKITVAKLGFPNGATTREIYARARELCLELCPREVGPALRLAYTDQPLGEWLNVGMDPITFPDGNPNVFGVGRGGDGLWLSSNWA